MTRECVFRGNRMLLDDVNPRLQRAWKNDGRQGYFPYSAATRIWKKEHCPQINPYGSEDCPYGRDECTLAYYQAMILTLDAHPDNYIAFARTVAKNSGMERADNKPLARDRLERTSGHSPREGGLRAGLRTGSLDDLAKADGQPVRLGEMEGREEPGVRRSSGLTRIGTLLGANDVRPLPPARRGDKGEESADNDGDAGLGVPGPHGGRPEGWLPVEHGAQAGDPTVRKEGE